MTSLSVSCRNLLSVQPYKSVNVAVQADRQRPSKSRSTDKVYDNPSISFFFTITCHTSLHLEVRGNFPTTQNIHSRMSLGRSGGRPDTAREECGQSLPTKRKPDGGRTTPADIQQKAFPLIKHTHAAFMTAGADQCRKSEVG